MDSYIVSTEKLTKSYRGQHAVKDLNLKIKEGDIYGFLGPNGAGKTTTIRMLLGLVKPTDGSISVFNKSLKKDRIQILGKVGSLVESPSYYGKLTALENLNIVHQILGVSKNRVDEVLHIVRLTKAKNKLVKEFSLGMKQRLGIAIALLGNPKLLVLDEPTNGLDPAGIEEMRELIKVLPEKYGMTVIVSSHLLSEIDQIATHVGIINEGNMIFQDSIDTLRQQSSPSIYLRVSDLGEAHSILLNHNIKVSRKNDSICLPYVHDKSIGDINKLLNDHSISVYRIEEKKRSLEKIFLDIIGRGGSL
jgi:lantibiotic transport system ATP-binding protein